MKILKDFREDLSTVRRDLKAENVLIESASYRAKVSIFSLFSQHLFVNLNDGHPDLRLWFICDLQRCGKEAIRTTWYTLVARP